MAGVLHDFECAAHGVFEKRVKADELPKCPQGCPRSFVKKVFLRAPAHVSNSTKFQDSAVRTLASDFGMTDVKNDKDGGSVMDAMRKGQDLGRPKFMEVPHAAPGWSQRGEAAPSFNPQAAMSTQVQGENAVMKLPAPQPVVGKGHSYRAPLPDNVP